MGRPRLRNVDDVLAYLRTIPADATDARKWQAVKTATHSMLRMHGVPNPSTWVVEALPPQAHQRHGDCYWSIRRIRYRKQFVTAWWTTSLAHVIAHECAHAITGAEMSRQGKRGNGGHVPMWKGTAAALGLNEGRPGAKTLPRANSETNREDT